METLNKEMIPISDRREQDWYSTRFHHTEQKKHNVKQSNCLFLEFSILIASNYGWSYMAELMKSETSSKVEGSETNCTHAQEHTHISYNSLPIFWLMHMKV